MAVIDSKKLLPPKSTGSALAKQKFLVPVSNIVPKSSAIVKGTDLKSSNVPQNQSGDLASTAIVIRKKFIDVEKIIGNNTNILKKSQEEKRKESEKEEFSKREQKLEERKIKPIPGIKIPSLPRTGFLDAIKRFLFYTMLGYAFNKFGKYIPKIIELTTKLTPVYKFFEDFTGNVLNGVIDFVDKGYKAYDKVRAITKSIGGENAEKKFDEFSKQFNTFANLAIVAAMATVNGNRRRPGGSTGGISAAASRSVGEFGIRSGYGAGTAMTPGRYRLPGQAKTPSSLGLEKARKGLSFEQSVAARQASKQIATQGAKQSLKSLVRVPIIGSLIGFIIDTVIFREKPTRAAAGAVGSALGQGIGIALAGGTTFGLGAGIGMLVGGFVGDILGKALYDTVVGYNQKPIKGKAQGGEVTRGGQRVNRPATRRIQRIKTRPPKIRPQKTIPGKDIGGKKEIEKLFPSPKDPKVRNPLGILETTSNKLKNVPMIGGLMGASLDLVMGQKPDPTVFRKIGNGFGTLIQNAINAETSTTLNNVQKEIVALANGGVVPRTFSPDENIGMKIGERIARTLETMVNLRVNETLQAIRKEFGKKDILRTDTLDDGITPGDSLNGLDGVDVKGEIIGYVGSTGNSTGPHIHFENLSGAKTDLPNNVRDNIIVGNKKMSSWTLTSSPGPRVSPGGIGSTNHAGEDWAMPSGLPIKLTGGLKFVKYVREGTDPRYSGYGNVTIIQDQRGKLYLLGHLSGGPSNPQKILEYQRQQATIIPPNLRGTGKIISGQASYYGGSEDKYWEGRQTASGEIFDSRKMTAAMMSPGFDGREPFWAKVTNNANGKSVIVKVNDTGGFTKMGRIIDLSKGAFSKIANTSSGIINVTVERLRSASTQLPPGQAQKPTSQPSQTGKVLKSTNVVGTIYTEREGGQYFQNGKPISKDIYDAVKKNHPSAFGNQASIAPSSSPNIAMGLNQTTSYDIAGGPTIMLQRVIIEKPIPMQNRSSGFIPLDNNTSSSNPTASLSIG